MSNNLKFYGGVKMKFLIAPDSFKGGLSNTEFCNIAARVLSGYGQECRLFPLSDGGDGFLTTYVSVFGGTVSECKVSDANFLKRFARYAFDGEKGVCAVSECASLANTMIKNPLFTTTFGLGEIIRLLLKLGKKEIIVGLGGSATNDGGAGMLSALGVKFYDGDGQAFVPVGNTLKNIKAIDVSDFRKSVEGRIFRVLTDVKNPLTGEEGCSRIFAPQKGASAQDVEELETNMLHYVTQTAFTGVDPNFEGAGAAGGLGYCFKAFFDAEIVSGAEYFTSTEDFEKAFEECDVVISGEGRFDETGGDSYRAGKICPKVISDAIRAGKKAAVFCGEKSEGFKFGEAEIVEINDRTISLKENIALCGEHLEKALRAFAEKIVGKTVE